MDSQCVIYPSRIVFDGVKPGNSKVYTRMDLRVRLWSCNFFLFVIIVSENI